MPCFLIAASPCAAQQQGATDLPRIVVTSPPPDLSLPTTPLNTGTIAESASRLGLTVREVPATVEVIDQRTMRERGYRTVTEAAQGAVGVTAGDAPGAPSAFSMRGYSFSEINTLYNGIKVGPQSMTSRPMDAFNLRQVEFFKGPASLMSGEGATGGSVNFVTKQPHTGKIENEALASYDSLNGYRIGFGSGGSTAVSGLDYRFDLTRASNNSFIHDTDTRLWNLSTQLDYRVSNSFKVWGAFEYKEDKSRFYWGTPLVSTAFSGAFATRGIVSGNWISNYNGSVLGPVTIDSRTLKTTYNVLDNDSGARELWLRTGFEWFLNKDVSIKSQFYSFTAKRHWFNNEVNAFNADVGLVDRERFYVAHDQRLWGNVTDLAWNSNIAGMENRTVVALAFSRLNFDSTQADNFPFDQVTLVDPARGLYGPLITKNFFTRLDNVSLSLEDRLKLTKTFSVIGGIRVEEIELNRNATDVTGAVRVADGYPFSKTWTPVNGRIGYSWEAVPGMTFYSQYATAADAAVANIFILRPTQPLSLTTSRIVETGVKQLLWDGRAEWTLVAFDIERRNVYSAKGGHLTNIAAKVHSKGFELAGAMRPTRNWKLWANVAYVEAKYVDFVDADTGQSFSGNTPPNVPRWVANAGASYRFATAWPIELGASVRYVGDRYVYDDNAVSMLGYAVADAFLFFDVPKSSQFPTAERTRISFRVRNLTDKKYAIWADPGYPDQVLLGAPRTFEIVASLRW